MHPLLNAIIEHMLAKHYIGGKHTPEQLVVGGKIKHLPKKERKAFLKEYQEFRNTYCIVLKKKTGKGDEWHISLDPHQLKEIMQVLNNGNI